MTDPPISRFPRDRSGAEVCQRLDAESRAWLARLHNPDRRDHALAELHELLRCEARFHIRWRTSALAGFPTSDIGDLAVQAADDALLALLRKLDDFRGDSQFLTWARRFAQLEAPVSVRRRLGRDQLARDPDSAPAIPDLGPSPGERAEVRELLQTIGVLVTEQLTQRQRTVLIATAVVGTSTAALAADLQTTPGAIYKALYDARTKLRAQLALG